MARPFDSEGRRGGRFATTHWSLIIAAGDGQDPQARKALAELCECYWPPVYAYVRRRGADRDRALDLTQGFFTRFVEKNYAADADRDRGKFRTFLLTSCKNYLAKEWNKSQTQKRGGDLRFVALQADEAENGYAIEPFDEETPEKIYDRRWARVLVQRVLDRLPEDGQRLRPFLVGEATQKYREAAAELGMSESAMKVAVHRYRRRFAALLRDEVSRTVGRKSDVHEELRHLMSVLAP